MSGDPFALDEDLHGARGETHLDFGAGEAVRNAVVVIIDIDVIVDADAAQAPFGEHVRLDRQRLERWSVELFQELPARASEAADRPLLVEPRKQFADRRVQFGEAMEHTTAQTADEPALEMSTQASTLALAKVVTCTWCGNDRVPKGAYHASLSSPVRSQG